MHTIRRRPLGVLKIPNRVFTSERDANTSERDANMGVDAYMSFQLYGGALFTSESQVSFATNNSGGQVLTELPWPFGSGVQGTVPSPGPSVFEIESFSLDVNQTLNIGTSGVGAGKVMFNPLSITRKIDKCSPMFFQHACSGTAFELVTLCLAVRSAVGAAAAGNSSVAIYARFDFKLVAVKSISWSYDDESPKEILTFEYGGLIVNYAPQNADGSMMTPVSGGWNRIENTQDTSPTLVPLPA